MLRKQQSLSQTDIYSELKKLKKYVVEASDYAHLEKCLEKIKSLKKQTKNYGSKDKKQLLGIIQTCESLISEKTNYFKTKIKRIVYDDANSQQQKSREKKLLKQCKSAQILLENKHKYNQPCNYVSVIKNKKNASCLRQKTQNSNCNCTIENKTQANIVPSNIQAFENRVNIIQQKIANDQLKNLFQHKQQAIFIQYEQRIREITLDRQQLKVKHKLLSEQNVQLKNRVLNEQKRQNNYIENLKEQIFALNHQLGKSHKDLLQKAYQIDQLIKINQYLKDQVRKLSIKNEQDKIKFDKEQLIIRQQMKNHLAQYQREVDLLQRQKFDIQIIKQQMMKQQQQKNKLYRKLDYCQKENKQLKTQLNKWKVSFQKLEDDFGKLEVEVCDLRDAHNKKDIYCNKLQDQLYQVRKVLIAIEEEQNYIQVQKQLQMKGKVNKLKQIKCLLQDIHE